MSDNLQRILFQATDSTFENLGFILPTHEIDAHQQEAKWTASVHVDFHGPREGRILIHAYGNWLPFLTANMMGEQDAPSERLQRDAFGEIANIICGNILPNIGEPNSNYQLDAPSFLEAGEALACLPAPQDICIKLGIEDGWIAVILSIQTD